MRAHEQGMDLIEVAPNAQPPVCRITDFGKYKYEEEKKEKALPDLKKVLIHIL